MVKIAVGAALGAFVDELANQGVGPIWVAVGAALVPVAINWLNPDDTRYGRNGRPTS
jgi:heme exporter protein D